MMTEKLRLICGIRAAPSPCICLACKQGKGPQCIRPYSKRIASGTFFSFRHQTISCPRLQLVAVSVSIGWRGLERRRETFRGRASKQAPFSSPSQVTVSGWTQQGTRSGPARAPGLVVALRVPLAGTSTSRHMPISRWHAGPTSLHLPPATRRRLSSVPSPHPRRLRAPHLPLRAGLSRTCPPSSPSSRCVRRPPQRWQRRSEHPRPGAPD